MSEPGAGLRVLLVDPSLFTAPYDAALTQGLGEAGVAATWAVRPQRAREEPELPAERAHALFYRSIERATWLSPRLRVVAKGLSHAVGLARLLARVLRDRPDIVHFQWIVVPPLDSVALWLLRRVCPVVLTVHDTVPFNGDRLSALQRWGFEVPLALCDRLIVHTRRGRERLLELGFAPEKIKVVPHGALPLRQEPSAGTRGRTPDSRYCCVVFGELKPYKGLDVLVEAVSQLSPEVRERICVRIAGRPRMDLAPLLGRIEQLGLGGTIEVTPERLTNQQMADLFDVAECFVFPYRQIDASGVYYLVKSLGKWLIASRVGIFAEDVVEGRQGALVPPGDAAALAAALTRAVLERRTPEPSSASADWTEIGRATQALYDEVLAARARGAAGAWLERGVSE
jgi:glycosyltransferase involved in cell wall biosynthesis